MFRASALYLLNCALTPLLCVVALSAKYLDFITLCLRSSLGLLSGPLSRSSNFLEAQFNCALLLTKLLLAAELLLQLTNFEFTVDPQVVEGVYFETQLLCLLSKNCTRLFVLVFSYLETFEVSDLFAHLCNYKAQFGLEPLLFVTQLLNLCLQGRLVLE